MDRQEIKSELSQILNRVGALKFGSFKLTSGKISPYYLDLRIIPSFPDAFKKICDIYMDLIRSEIGEDAFDRIAGIPTAGISFGSIAAYKLEKAFVYVRTSEREHGRGRRVEGILLPGDRVLLIDDLITKGGSILKAAEAVRAEGGLVSDVVVLLNRQENGEKSLENDGIKLHYVLTISELASNLNQIEAITKKQMDTILKQIK